MNYQKEQFEIEREAQIQAGRAMLKAEGVKPSTPAKPKRKISKRSTRTKRTTPLITDMAVLGQGLKSALGGE